MTLDLNTNFTSNKSQFEKFKFNLKKLRLFGLKRRQDKYLVLVNEIFTYFSSLIRSTKRDDQSDQPSQLNRY